MKKLISGLAVGVISFAALGTATYAANEAPAVTTSKVATSTAGTIEADILSVQKDVVGIVRQAISYYLKGDIKESGDTAFNFEYVGEQESFKVKFELEKYVSILSIMNGNQQMDFVGTTTIDAQRNHGTEEKLSATVKFDVSMKIIGNDLFLTVNKLTIERTGTDKLTKSFDSAVEDIPPVEGKTIRIPLGKNSGRLNQAQVMKKVDAVLDILETDALLTPKAKKKDGYQLVIKRATAQKINLAIGEKKNAGLNQANLSKEVLMYSNDGNTLTLWSESKDSLSKTRVAIVRKAGAYEFQFDDKGFGRNKQSMTSARISTTYATIQSTDKNYAFNLNWKDNVLSTSSKWREYSWETGDYTWNTIDVAGPLSMTDIDLTIKYNGKDAGYVKASMKDNVCTYDMGLTVDYEGKFNMSVIGKKLVEFGGTYDIVKPTTYIDIRKLQK